MLTSERFRTAKTQTGHQKKFRCRLVRLSMLKLGDGVWEQIARVAIWTGINIDWSKRTGRLQLASISREPLQDSPRARGSWGVRCRSLHFGGLLWNDLAPLWRGLLSTRAGKPCMTKPKLSPAPWRGFCLRGPLHCRT